MEVRSVAHCALSGASGEKRIGPNRRRRESAEEVLVGAENVVDQSFVVAHGFGCVVVGCVGCVVLVVSVLLHFLKVDHRGRFYSYQISGGVSEDRMAWTR
jgi:hypothetical protein